MALIASIQFGDNESKLYSRSYNVSNVKCSVMRPSSRYTPEGPTRCERIDITVVAPGKTDLTLLEWYVHRSAMTGRIVISMSNEARLDGSTENAIYFENAVCFELSEDYHIDDSRRRLLNLSFNAEVLTMDNVVFS